jgi:hypothetical protein
MRPAELRCLLIFLVTVVPALLLTGCHAKASAPATANAGLARPQPLAFPGAEGYGRFATGGRGGRVIEVTNLQDYDPKTEPAIPGSFRAAIDVNEPRTIIFRVSGIIELKSPIVVKYPYCTIAGQTAPGDGICFKGRPVGVGSATNVIVRYLRIRVGDESGHPFDGAGLQGDNNIMDHCSISWSMDEGLSTRQAKNVTFQRCIISEALHDSWNYQPHSFAASIGGEIASFHHNLLAQCAGRVWSLAGGISKQGKLRGSLDIRNNVVYNWKHRNTDGGAIRVNFVANYYKPGPATEIFSLMRPDIGVPGDRQVYFITGNIMEGRPEYDQDNWKGVFVPWEAPPLEEFKSSQPLFEPYVKTTTAQQAYTDVLADVGANRPKQDAIDQRIIHEVRDSTFTFTGSRMRVPGIIDSQTDIGPNPWPQYKTYDAPVDSDRDGLPDWWEKKHGTNHNSSPGDFSDSNADPDGDGYTNLEDYLNYLAAGGKQDP